MMATPFAFEVAALRGADRTPEDRGTSRDGVRLLVTEAGADRHRRFADLPDLLEPGDLLVVNESATLPASLPARGSFGEFRISASTAYGADLWLVEPRWDFSRPGPLPIRPGDSIEVGGLRARYVADFPGAPRLGFVRIHGDLRKAMEQVGQPVRYGYLARAYPLEEYQTIFARVPGSAEMPSAGRPFSRAVLDRLQARGVSVAPIVLHTGVSSLEVGDALPGTRPVFPEAFAVPSATVAAIQRTRNRGRRVIAVGTTVVRALESATDRCGLRAARGFTRVYLQPERGVRSIDGVITGLHEARSTHLELLSALIGRDRLLRAYRVAIEEGYVGHEFGDSHLIFGGTRVRRGPTGSAG